MNLTAPLDRRGAAQLVDGELDRTLDDFATQKIALDRRQHGQTVRPRWW